MNNVAVFVDAGYLITQGSVVLTEQKAKRANCILNIQNVISGLVDIAISAAPGCRLLRIYWYDAPPPGGQLSAEQVAIAATRDVKLRLGKLNVAGQQKGVDSLIITDLVELARQKSIADAVVVTGDEDVRIGIAIAQGHGIRVHVLGLAAKSSSQSLDLVHEADTHQVWGRGQIEPWLSIRPEVPQVHVASPVLAHTITVADEPKLSSATQDYATQLNAEQRKHLVEFWRQGQRGIPPEFDKALLAACRAAVGRPLERAEKHEVRSMFRRAIVGNG